MFLDYTVIGLGLLCAFVGFFILRAVLPILDANVLAAAHALESGSRGCFRSATKFAMHEASNGNEAISLSWGALCAAALLWIFLETDVLLLKLTLFPMLEVGPLAETMQGTPSLVAYSVVALAAVYGVCVGDLLGWSKITNFAKQGRARRLALIGSSLFFAVTVSLGIALGYYRGEVLGISGVEIELRSPILDNLTKSILIALTADLFVGVGVCVLIAFERVLWLGAGLLGSAAGCALVLGAAVLRLVAFFGSLVLAMLDGFASSLGRLGTFLQELAGLAARAFRAVHRELGSLVGVSSLGRESGTPESERQIGRLPASGDGDPRGRVEPKLQ